MSGPAIEVRGADRVAARLSRAGGEAQTAIERVVVRASVQVRNRWVKRLSGPRGAGGFWGVGRVAGAALGARSGQTRARISPGGVLIRRGREVMAVVGSPDKHLLLHEEGGVVPGWSRIPTANAQTAAGVDINAGRSVRGLPGYRLIRTGQGRLWIVRQSGFARVGQPQGGNAARIDFMYLLKRNVRHRARGIAKAVTAEMEPVMVQDARVSVAVVAGRANG